MPDTDIPYLKRGDIRKLLRDPKLLQMTQVFYHALESANPHRHIRDRALLERRMDALARLLVGDETCTAIAWNTTTNKLNISSNDTNHSTESIRVFAESIIEPGSCFFPQGSFSPAIMRFRLRMHFEIKTPDQEVRRITKHHEALIAYFYDSTRDVLIKGYGEKSKIIFSLLPEEHQLPGHKVLSVNLPLRLEIPEIRQKMYNEDIARILRNEHGEAPAMESYIATDNPLIATPLPTPLTQLNPLRRRINTLFQHLSMITLIAKEKRSSSPDYVLIEKGIMAAASFRHEVLYQSLAWEAASWSRVSSDLRTYTDATNTKFLEKISQVIHFLNNNLNQFKRTQDDLSIPSVYIDHWIENILSNEALTQALIEMSPKFIADNPKKFLDRAKRYFIDLEKIEKHIFNNLNDPDGLWQLFDNFDIFSDNDRYEIFDTTENKLHAEMRLLDSYFQKRQMPSYMGITKLCCAHCNWVMQRLGVPGFSGGHAKVYGWTFPTFLLQGAKLGKLLGAGLFEQYKNVMSEDISLDGKRMRKSDAFLGIIVSITSLNPNDIKEFNLGSRKLADDAAEHAYESDEDLLESHEYSETMLTGSSEASVSGVTPNTTYFSSSNSPHLLSQLNMWGLTSSKFVSHMVVAALLFIIFVIWQTYSKNKPSIPFTIFKNKTYSAVLVAFFLEQYAFSASMILIALFFQKVLGISVLKASIMFLALNLVFGLVAPFGGMIVDKIGIRTPALFGSLVLALGLTCFAGLTVSSSSSAIYLSLIITGLGMGVAFAAFNSGMVKTIDAEDAGTASSVFLLIALLGNVCGIVISTLIYQVTAVHALLQSVAQKLPFSLAQMTQLKNVVHYVGNQSFQLANFSAWQQHTLITSLPNSLNAGISTALIVAALGVLLASTVVYCFINKETN